MWGDMVMMTAQTSDNDLALSAAAGNRDAFTELVRRYSAPLLAFCQQLLRDRNGAEDVVQESLLKAYRSLERFDPQRRFGAWLYKIAQNLCFDQLRARRRLQPLPEIELAAAPPLTEAHFGELDAAVARLGAKHQAVLHYKYALGWNAREIAEQLELSPSDVRVCLHRAIKTLRERLA